MEWICDQRITAPHLFPFQAFKRMETLYEKDERCRIRKGFIRALQHTVRFVEEGIGNFQMKQTLEARSICSLSFTYIYYKMELIPGFCERRYSYVFIISLMREEESER